MIATRFYVAAAIGLLILAIAWVVATQGVSTREPAPVSIAEASIATPTKSVEKAPAKAISMAHTPDKHQVDDLVQQKYAMLFSALQLTPTVRARLQDFLREREAIAGRSFYDAGNNAAEIAENLRQRELDVADVDERIAQLLTDEDAKKYALLKDSTYEQALLEDFYRVAGMDAAPEQQKLNLLLSKLEQKQKVAALVADASEQIAHAAPTTRIFLIEQAHTAFFAAQEDYLLMAKTGMSDEQFALLRDYEQQLSDERWQDLLSSWQ